MLDFLTDVMNVNQWTLFIVGALSACAGYMLKEALSSGLIASIFFPFFLLAGLVSRHLFIEYGIFISDNKDANLIMATCAGLIVSLALLTILLRLYMFATKIRTRADTRSAS